MSIHDKHKESKFETEIVEYLISKDWIEGTSSGYDKKLALYTEDLISHILKILKVMPMKRWLKEKV